MTALPFESDGDHGRGRGLASIADLAPIDLTIAIPAHNEALCIGRCLAAAITDAARAVRDHGGPLAGKCIEIVVVDNASSDETAAIAALHAGPARVAGIQLRVIAEPRKGLTRARQTGHEAARGGIVAWIDADTEMPPGWLNRVAGLLAGDDVVCVSGPYRYPELSAIQRAMVVAYWWLIAAPSYHLTGYMAVGGNFAVRRSAVDAIGGFDTRIAFFGEDTDIARRLAGLGRVVFNLGLVMPTSARRFAADGFLRTGYRYATNFLAEVILKRPLDTPYRDVR